jgi:hypothetical protein
MEGNVLISPRFEQNGVSSNVSCFLLFIEVREYGYLSEEKCPSMLVNLP